jgi:phage terminase small subunit
MNEETILSALHSIAFSDFTDYIRVEDGAVVVTDTCQLTDDQRAAIAGIKDTGKGVEIKLHDKQKALELLVKYLGLFEKPQEEPTLRVELADVPEEWTE